MWMAHKGKYLYIKLVPCAANGVHLLLSSLLHYFACFCLCIGFKTFAVTFSCSNMLQFIVTGPVVA